ncbi:MAG TPA: hypothetical protein VFL41_12635 [Gaiellaceae bacterium]|nr:hypothetical protein [Gaiellaceae bacterium]
MADPDPRLVRNDTIRTFLTPLTIVVTALTVFLGFRHDDATQRQAAKNTFQLEAAKLVMSQQTCEQARLKAATLVRLFPGRLPDNFVNQASARLVRTSRPTSGALKGSTVTETLIQGPCGTKKVSATAVGPPLVQPPAGGR